HHRGDVPDREPSSREDRGSTGRPPEAPRADPRACRPHPPHPPPPALPPPPAPGPPPPPHPHAPPPPVPPPTRRPRPSAVRPSLPPIRRSRLAPVCVPGLEGAVAFDTVPADPDTQRGALRHRGVDIEHLVGKVPFGNVWGLLVDGAFNPGLPPAEPFPIPVHS